MKPVNPSFLKLLACFFLSVSALSLSAQQTPSGIFEGQTTLGTAGRSGSVKYDKLKHEYALNAPGAGEGGKDAVQYAWKKIKGDFIVQAQGGFQGQRTGGGGKFGLMIRSSADAGSAQVAAVVQGDGQTFLRYGKDQGGQPQHIKSPVAGADVIQLERRGTKYILSAAKFGQPYVTTETDGPELGEEVFVGLFISSGNGKAGGRAVMHNVRITLPAGPQLVPYKEYLGSRIETMDVESGRREVVFTSPKSLQAPNWMHDGRSLIYNSEGLMYRMDLKIRKPEVINTDFVSKNNNDHVISFDGKMLGLSSSSGDEKYGSLIFTVPIAGGKPTQITPTGPSYLHGWSPDGKYLVFTGQRNDEFDIYRVPSSGGPEVRLTDAKGLDDGSEYTPDGKYIYFNSVRTGSMQIFRMDAEGNNEEQLTDDDFNNWFPHVSPDGKWVVFLSFMKDVPAGDHPFYKHVYLRLMPLNGGKPKVIGYLYGGQGTINTPSWSPDSKKIAFVSNSGDVE